MHCNGSWQLQKSNSEVISAADRSHPPPCRERYILTNHSSWSACNYLRTILFNAEVFAEVTVLPFGIPSYISHCPPAP